MLRLNQKFLRYTLCSWLLCSATPSFSNQWLTRLATQMRHKLPTWLGGYTAPITPFERKRAEDFEHQIDGILLRSNRLLDDNLKRRLAALQPPIAPASYTYRTQPQELAQLRQTRWLLLERLESEQKNLAHLQATNTEHPALIPTLTPKTTRTEAKLSASRDHINSSRRKIQDLQQRITALETDEISLVKHYLVLTHSLEPSNETQSWTKTDKR